MKVLEKTALGMVAEQEEEEQKQPKRLREPRVIAIVPAYNEELLIAHTLASLYNQTHRPYQVIVIANNCRDSTADIVRDLRDSTYGDWLLIHEEKSLPGKKAAALNIGFEMADKSCDFILQMDSDTILHEKVIEYAIAEFEKDARVGGVGAAFHALPLPGTEKHIELMKDAASNERPTFWQTLLWKMQNIEYGGANAWRMENNEEARVLAGACTVYRYDTLQDVARLHDGQIWPVDSLVEDYVVTLWVKDEGWIVKSLIKMEAWTDVPLSLFGKGSLTGQRDRWYGGTIEEIKKRPFKAHSRGETKDILVSMLMFLVVRNIFLAYVALSIYAGAYSFTWTSVLVIAAIPLLRISFLLYRYFRYVQEQDVWQFLIVSTIVLMEIYTLYIQCIYLKVIIKSMRKRQRGWT